LNVLVTGIKSKPVYAPLRADTRGRYHLMLGAGVANLALRRVLAELEVADPAALSRTRVLCLPARAADAAAASDAATDPLRHLGLLELHHFGDIPALLAQFRVVLEKSLMGTRLYVAGPESFIGLAMKIALEFNLNKDEIRAEQMGSLARRVFCVHCRNTSEEVRTNIVRCGGCDRWLLVRDHYSRRLAAYMGVMVDAEAPGDIPAIREVYV
jgi:hypothetical protein